MRFSVNRKDGDVEPIHIQAVGVTLNPGDNIEMFCASGGGYGDPLDRDPQAVLADLLDNRIDESIARDIYGLILTEKDIVNPLATEEYRLALRKERLKQAGPAKDPLHSVYEQSMVGEEKGYPLYPGVIQRGNLAISEHSGAVLAVAPGNWLDGCPVLETKIDERDGGVYMRAFMDPLTGRFLHVDVGRSGDGPSIEIRPERWVHAGLDVSAISET